MSHHHPQTEIEIATAQIVEAIDCAASPEIVKIPEHRRQRVREMATEVAIAWLSRGGATDDRMAGTIGRAATVCAVAAYDAIEAAVAELE